MSNFRIHPRFHWIALLAILVNALLPSWVHAGAVHSGSTDLCLSGATTGRLIITQAGSPPTSDGAHVPDLMACCAVCAIQASASWIDISHGMQAPALPDDATPGRPLGHVTPHARDNSRPDSARAPPTGN